MTEPFTATTEEVQEALDRLGEEGAVDGTVLGIPVMETQGNQLVFKKWVRVVFAAMAAAVGDRPLTDQEPSMWRYRYEREPGKFGPWYRQNSKPEGEHQDREIQPLYAGKAYRG